MNSVIENSFDKEIGDTHHEPRQHRYTTSLSELSFTEIKQLYMPVFIESLRIVGLLVFKDQENLQSFFFYSFKKGFDAAISFIHDQNQSEAILEGMEKKFFIKALGRFKLNRIKPMAILKKIYKLSCIGFIAGVQSSLKI